MTQIKPITSNDSNFSTKKVTLDDIDEKNESIFLKFDTDSSKSISDDEIRAQGFVGELFNKAKQKLIQIFGVNSIENLKGKDGYFYYEGNNREIVTAQKFDDIPTGSHKGVRDARGYDISQLNLSRKELLDLCIDKTTVLSAEQKAIIDEVKEKAKDPGLGVRSLHKQGFTGKGVRMAIIDQPIGKHKEYSSRIVKNVDINTNDVPSGWRQASMHAAAVTSIAVGETVGVAPEAEVEFYSAVNLSYDPKEIQEYNDRINNEIKKHPNNSKYLQEQLQLFKRKGCCPSNKPYVDAINQILDNNEKVPENEKVTVISISWGFDEFAPGYEDLKKAIDRAKQQGVFIVSTALSEHYGFNTCGANRNPDGNLDDPDNYEAGAFFKNRSEKPDEQYRKELLLVPMDHRTVADYTDGESYRYEGNDGGMSWSTPWLASMYALAKQADSNITPEKFWAIALLQSDECNNNDSGKNVGRIINPQKLIDEVIKQKDNPEPIILESNSFKLEQKYVQTRQNDTQLLQLQKPSTDELKTVVSKKYNELKEKYKSDNLDIKVEITSTDNMNYTISYTVQTKTNI